MPSLNMFGRYFRRFIFTCLNGSKKCPWLLFQLFPDTGPHLLALPCKGWRHEHLTLLSVACRRRHPDLGLLAEKVFNLVVTMPVGNNIDEGGEILRLIEIVQEKVGGSRVVAAFGDDRQHRRKQASLGRVSRIKGVFRAD